MNGLKTKKDLTVLAIETSCDETACAIMREDVILGSVISTQIDIHRKFGGVVPEIASRSHALIIGEVVRKALDKSEIGLKDIDAIAVTYGAGLQGALLVGVSYAKGLAYALNKPFVAVNHIRGHIAANYIAHKDLTPPYISLIVSGGHSAVVFVKNYTEFDVMGSTLDDAAGEAFDKVARVLGLPYPGGPEIEKLAKTGTPCIGLPVAKTHNELDFSYSGLKTAVINYINQKKQKNETYNKADVAASFQKTAVAALVKNAVLAARIKGIRTITLAGGVSANEELRRQMEIAAISNKLSVLYPPLWLCTDNAAMIAKEAIIKIRAGEPFAKLSLDASMTIPL